MNYSELEAITTTTGVTFTTCTMETNHNDKDGAGEQREQAEWHHLTVFGSLAEVVDEWVHKGHRLYVEGRIQSRERHAVEGRVRRYYDTIVNELVMLGSTTGAEATR